MSINQSIVNAELVRAAEVALCQQYNALFRAYPAIVDLYRKNGGRTAYVIRAQFNQIALREQLADDESVMRLLSLWSYVANEPIPVNLILVDEEFANMLLIGKTLGYIKLPGH
jgi:hypothetical protein